MCSIKLHEFGEQVFSCDPANVLYLNGRSRITQLNLVPAELTRWQNKNTSVKMILKQHYN